MQYSFILSITALTDDDRSTMVVTNAQFCPTLLTKPTRPAYVMTVSFFFIPLETPLFILIAPDQADESLATTSAATRFKS